MHNPTSPAPDLTGNGNPYAIAVLIQTSEEAPVVASQIQAVYDDDSRAPDGSFLAVETERGMAIIFLRDAGADEEVIEAPLTRSNALAQLAREFEPTDEDAPAIREIHAALLAQQDEGRIAPDNEGWDLFEITLAGHMQIQREDEIDTFMDDDEALAFVEQKAAEGSLYHLEAVAIHKDAETIAEGMAKHA